MGGAVGTDGNGVQAAGGTSGNPDAEPTPSQVTVATEAAARPMVESLTAAAQAADGNSALQNEDGTAATAAANRKATLLANLADTSAPADTDTGTSGGAVPAVQILTAPIIAAALDGAGGKHARGDATPAVDSAASGAMALAGAAPSPSGAAAAGAPAALKLDVPVGSPDFPQALADKVSWMVDQNVTGARLQVNPPQLGPIEVRITVQGDRAQVWLSAHNNVTREALEAGSPKLREMLGGQGFGQVSVDVSQRSFQERTPQSQAYERVPPPDEDAVAQTGRTTAAVTRVASGSLDAYA
jgi:flagellar hook-length control protein FliK